MEKSTFKTTINAPRERVWDILWGDKTYSQWTAPFSPDSRAKTDWKKGSKVLFTGGKDDSGMVAEIVENIPNEYMSIRHIGMIKDGKEITDSEEVKEWSGAMENYTLKEAEGGTELLIDMDMEDKYKEEFTRVWPQALQKVKELAENNN